MAFHHAYCNRKFVLSIYSPDMPENEATFSITAGGVNDAKE